MFGDEMYCETPGMKIRSRGMGRGLARGRGRGPIGVPVGAKRGISDTGMGAGFGLGGPFAGISREELAFGKRGFEGLLRSWRKW